MSAKRKMKSGSKKLAAWVRVQIPARARRKNIQAGYFDATGFHPIRSSSDYDPDRAGDEYSDKPKRKAAKKKAAKKKNKGIHSRKMPFFLPAKRKPRKKNAARKNPKRVGAKLPRTGHTGMMKAKGVDVITRGGKIVEVKVKR